MKKAMIVVGLMVVSGTAFANISKSAGICGAYQLFVAKDEHKARMAMNHAENKGIMQVAANKWVETVQKDPARAVQQAQMACIYDLRIAMK